MAVLGTLRRGWLVVTLAALLGLLPAAPGAASARVKDVATVDGVRDNQLVGYGLVIGLNGTGDKKMPFTNAAVANMLNKLGVKFDPGKLKAKNIASVLVTATLPPYAQTGHRIDVTVSSLGDAKSLQGGVLVMTPLIGADSTVYAVAQGAVSIGGFESKTRKSSQKKHLTVARVPGGALIEREVPSTITDGEYVVLTLHEPDFTTAQRLVRTLTLHFHEPVARALNGGAVRVRIPSQFAGDPVAFIAELEDLPIRPDTVARVVINERTGTVVVGEHVRIYPVAIAHGDLTIKIQEDDPESGLTAGAEARIGSVSGASVREIARALNALGVLPQEIIAIFQAIKEAGALPAQLEVM